MAEAEARQLQARMKLNPHALGGEDRRVEVVPSDLSIVEAEKFEDRIVRETIDVSVGMVGNISLLLRMFVCPCMLLF